MAGQSTTQTATCSLLKCATARARLSVSVFTAQRHVQSTYSYYSLRLTSPSGSPNSRAIRPHRRVRSRSFAPMESTLCRRRRLAHTRRNPKLTLRQRRSPSLQRLRNRQPRGPSERRTRTGRTNRRRGYSPAPFEPRH